MHKRDDHEEVLACFWGRGRVIRDNEEREMSRDDVLIFKPWESQGFRSNEIDP